jgi:hypothetical protein
MKSCKTTAPQDNYEFNNLSFHQEEVHVKENTRTYRIQLIVFRDVLRCTQWSGVLAKTVALKKFPAFNAPDVRYRVHKSPQNCDFGICLATPNITANVRHVWPRMRRSRDAEKTEINFTVATMVARNANQAMFAPGAWRESGVRRSVLCCCV